MVKSLWVEKHRPLKIEDVVGQDVITSEIRSIVNSGNMQHFIFYSPEPGTGKTSLAYAIAKELDYQVHRFNASSKKQRGIEFVEEDVAPLSRLGQWETIFLLDEADRITTQAQDALKGVIEDAQGYFILTCNDLSRVSPWLQSRCQVRHFKPIDQETICKRLAVIAAREGVEVTDSDIKAIAKHHEGDLRNAISALQSYSCLPQEDANQFIRSLYVSTIDAKKFLTLVFKEKSIDTAYDMLDSTLPRKSIQSIFEFGVTSPASNDAHMKLIEASVVAERDLINGVEPTIALWNFCRLLTL
tara:strand:+ start:3378 stop:4277 length:900 start_codon:yes stop_codon:yes gene_type:complete